MSAESSKDKLDRIVAQAQAARQEREQGYRARALKMYPWICGRCAREFNHENLRELTVHHRDHNHDNNPADGSNWELLCVYCHDNEHSRETDSAGAELTTAKRVDEATCKPFAELASMLDRKKK
jgi:5-methylcytosine-specific restriction endonuclease McrA